jgi:bifunctional UDP-N-acetylglucosamine pyrophosphorylase/glucosamine-1-phosphate N-acetyltransferase
MKGIILAAGKGLRLRPLTLETPKPLIKIKGETLLERLVRELPPFDELIIVTGYLAGQIEDFVENKLSDRKTICVRQPEPKGTFDALACCRPLIADKERFAVFFPDDLIDNRSITECLKYDLAAVVKETNDPERFGIVAVDPDGFIVDAVEKPKNPFSNLALASGYVLDADIFRYPPPLGANDEYHLSEAIARLSKTRKVKTVKSDSWFPISSAEDLLEAEKILNR